MAIQELVTGEQDGTTPRSDRKLTLRRWALVARGILALTFGIGVLIELVTRGDLQLRSYLLFFGVYALIDGALTFFVAWRVDNAVSPSGMFFFESLVGLSVGLITIVLALFGGASVTLSLFSAVVVIWALATGAFEATSATMTNDVTLAVASLLSISLGALMFGFRLLGFGEQSLLIVFAGYLFVVGVVYPPLPVDMDGFTPFTGPTLRNHLGILIDVYRQELKQSAAESRIDPTDADTATETEDAEYTPPSGEGTVEESSGTTPTDPSPESATRDPGAGLSASSRSASADPSISIARYFLDRAEAKLREGDLASCVTYFYRANEEKITIRAERKPEELHQIAKRIVSIGGHHFDEERVTAIEDSLFTEGKLTATPNDLRNEWRNVYNASIRQLKSVLVVRFLLRIFSAVLLVGLIALGALGLGLPTSVVENVAPESPADAPLNPFVVAVMLLGVLGSAVNNARTWTAQEPTLKIRQFQQESVQLSLSLSIAVTRLLVGATVAVFIYYLAVTDLITIAGESAALYLAIAFAAGFSDELVSKGVDKLLGEITEKSSEAAAEKGSEPSALQPATGTLTIVVKNGKGVPVSGANVTISGRVDTERHEKTTNCSGKAKFSKLTVDTYTVIATKGTKRGESSVGFRNESKDVEITIKSEAGGEVVATSDEDGGDGGDGGDGD